MTGVALAVMLSGGLTACTGSSDEGDGEDTKPGTSSSAAPPAEPGRYSTLPEPCGAVGVETLKKLLPGAEAAEDTAASSASGKGTDDEKASPYEGEATVTYDTDRRVGCRWKSATSLASRHLTVDLERVVSYDPAVSDDEQAQLLYDERAGQAEIPTDDESSPPPEDAEGGGEDSSADDSAEGDGDGSGDGKSGDESESADNGSGGDGGSDESDNGSQAPGEPGDAAESSQPQDEDLSPRKLDGLGDGAYIDDQLDTGDSGVHRDITVVFRSGNVIATVKYDQWLTDKRRTPDSAELQEKARSVAAELAAGFDDN
ncbi:hypothetical protein [Streptomyces abyssalis]|uniref:hypothetical protein n=1 Tax=Streptomyces abyssalis TaxID=933944 RepID=UPI0009A043F9|nr:hypothetical protein [Streptomyces abyssalis]